MRSYPLLLSQRQKERLLKKCIETYWEYTGKYYFLSQNCASELRDLLRSVIRTPHIASSRAATPRSVLRALKRDGLVDRDVVKQIRSNPDDAMSQGHLFPSKKDALNKAFSVFQQPYSCITTSGRTSTPAYSYRPFPWHFLSFPT